MTQSTNTTDELNKIMADSLFQLKRLIDHDPDQEFDLLSIVKVFLLGVVSTAVDLVEMEHPESAPLIYADVEAAAKAGGLRSIKKMQSQNGSMQYSVSNIDANDAVTAMNYLGQELSTALFKGIHELPLPLRKPEMFLRGIEALLANLLNQKFNNSHQVLDSLCEHVHMMLRNLEKQKH